ncbi:MAG: O-antigen ligase family protein [Elusimicrobiota bacterium]
MMPACPSEGDKRYLLPAIFLPLAAVLGGLRAWGDFAAFSAIFFIYIAFFDDDFSFSGLGVWGLLAAWLGISVAFSPEIRNSFWQFSKYAVLFSFYIFSSRRPIEARRAWAWSVFLLGGLAACLSVYEGVLNLPRGSVLGFNPNYGAAFIAAALAGTVSLLMNAGCKKRWLGAAAGLALFSAGLLASNSRGGLLAALAALFYLLFLKKAWRPLLYLAAGLLLVTVLLPMEQFRWMLKLDDPVSLERLKIWRTALGAIGDSPFFGYGPGLFERVFEVLKFPFYNGISYYGHSTVHAHSELLNLAAEAGIPAAGLFIWGWSRAVFAADDGDRWGTVLKVFAVSLFAQSAVDIIFYSGALQLFFFGTLGLLAAGKDRPADAPGSRVRALSLLLACWCAAFILRSGFERDKACALDGGISQRAREACLKKAAVFAPGDAALLNVSIPLSFDIYGDFAYTAAVAGSAAMKRPRDPFPLFARAQAFYMAGALNSAKAELYGVLALEPAFLRARLRLAEILSAETNYPAGVAQLRQIESRLAGKGVEPRTAYDRDLLSLPAAPYAKISKEIQRRE